MSEAVFLQSLPPHDDRPFDGRVAHIFANNMDTFLGFEHCFSSAYYSLYILSANNRVLRHVLFAFVSYLHEADRFRQSALCYTYLNNALPELQRSLTAVNFDEGEALAIPLLAYLA